MNMQRNSRGITLIGFADPALRRGFLRLSRDAADSDLRRIFRRGQVDGATAFRRPALAQNRSIEEIRRDLQRQVRHCSTSTAGDVPPQAIQLKREKRRPTLRIAYEKRVAFMYNIDLVVTFDKSVNLACRWRLKHPARSVTRSRTPALLAQALTHRSAGQHNNERLEFLGDALVNLIVAELIFEQHPRADEGEMTRLRAALVNGGALAVDRTRRRDRRSSAPGSRRAQERRLPPRFDPRRCVRGASIAAIYLDAGWLACRDARAADFSKAAARPARARRRKTRRHACRNACRRAHSRCRCTSSSRAMATITPRRSKSNAASMRSASARRVRDRRAAAPSRPAAELALHCGRRGVA